MSNLTTKSNQSLQNPDPEDEIDLKELFMVLWSGKWLISAITGVAAAISVAFASSLPNIYTASALLAPAESSGGDLSGLMKQYGGIASLAGVSLSGGGEGSRAQLGMQLMESRAFIGDFVERRDILPELMALKSWDSRSGSLIYDAEVFNERTRSWVNDSRPSRLAAHDKFTSLLSISQDKNTGFVTVSIEHISPELAAKWVNMIIKDVNSSVRNQDIDEANQSIEFLKQQAANTSLADLQSMFYALIQSQTETAMLAEVRSEYVFKTIDPAVTPESRSSPRRTLICVIGTVLGSILGTLVILLRHYLFTQLQK